VTRKEVKFARHICGLFLPEQLDILNLLTMSIINVDNVRPICPVSDKTTSS